MSARVRVLWASLVLAPFVACTLGAGSFAGKTCDTQADCPDPYVCAQVRPGGSTCELLHGLDTFATDGGGTGGGGGGSVIPDWCHDVSPIMMTSCVSNCHGTDHSYIGTPTTFRLDVYTIDGGQGAFDKAPNIEARVTTDTMPPIGVDPRPTMAERVIITNWVSGGAPYCNDGGP